MFALFCYSVLGFNNHDLFLNGPSIHHINIPLFVSSLFFLSHILPWRYIFIRVIRNNPKVVLYKCDQIFLLHSDIWISTFVIRKFFYLIKFIDINPWELSKIVSRKNVKEIQSNEVKICCHMLPSKESCFHEICMSASVVEKCECFVVSTVPFLGNLRFIV